MLRVIHSQSEEGTIILSDIEDGVRFNSRHILDASKRALLKQQVLVPYENPDDAAQPGFVDLQETDNVLLSADHGCIKGLQDNGLATVQIFSAADLTAPAITTADLDNPGAGDLTVTGTDFLSIPPDVSKLVLTGTGAVELTQAQVTGGGGTWSDTSIVVPAALVPGVATGTTSATVRADGQDSNTVALS